MTTLLSKYNRQLYDYLDYTHVAGEQIGSLRFVGIACKSEFIACHVALRLINMCL